MLNPQDLQSFTPEQIADLQQMLTSNDMAAKQRTVAFRPRQLHNLTLQPTATDARPLFIPSAESPRNEDVSKTYPYPKLLMSRDGEEITVRSAQEDRQKQAEGYLEMTVWNRMQAEKVAPDVRQQASDALAGLTLEEIEAIQTEQKRLRMIALQQKLANLPDLDVESVLKSALSQAKGSRKKAASNE